MSAALTLQQSVTLLPAGLSILWNCQSHQTHLLSQRRWRLPALRLLGMQTLLKDY